MPSWFENLIDKLYKRKRVTCPECLGKGSIAVSKVGRDSTIRKRCKTCEGLKFVFEKILPKK